MFWDKKKKGFTMRMNIEAPHSLWYITDFIFCL